MEKAGRELTWAKDVGGIAELQGAQAGGKVGKLFQIRICQQRLQAQCAPLLCDAGVRMAQVKYLQVWELPAQLASCRHSMGGVGRHCKYVTYAFERSQHWLERHQDTCPCTMKRVANECLSCSCTSGGWFSSHASWRDMGTAKDSLKMCAGLASDFQAMLMNQYGHCAIVGCVEARTALDLS